MDGRAHDRGFVSCVDDLDGAALDRRQLHHLVEEAIRACGATVEIAARNAPASTVVSGAEAAVDAVMTHLASKNIRCVRLPVSPAGLYSLWRI